MTIIEQIKTEWNAKVEVPVNDTPTLIHRDKGILMCNLILEEIFELRDALDMDQRTEAEKKDRTIEIADALGDILYLVYGTVSQYGINPNIKQKLDVDHTSNIFFDLRLQNDYMRSGIQADQMDDYWRINEIARALFTIESMVFEYCKQTKIFSVETLKEVVKEIHRSNLTKQEDREFIFREDGKVLKGKYYEKPNIGSILFNN